MPHSSPSARESNHRCALEYCGCSRLVSAIRTFESSKFLRIKLLLLKLLHHFRGNGSAGPGKEGKAVGGAFEFEVFRLGRRGGFGFADELIQCGAEGDAAGGGA